MIYTQSPLAKAYNWGTKNSNPRTNAKYNPSGSIKKITIHHMAGNMGAEACANMHHSGNASSANYYINGKDIVAGVPESRRAWTSGSPQNDYNAITIEVANCAGAPNWEISGDSMESVIKLCVDICKRDGIKQLNFTGNANGNLTMHCYFQNTTCPGPYLKSKFSYITDEVNNRLSGERILYRVQVGSFQYKSNAEKLQKELISKGYKDCFITEVKL